MHPRKLIRDSIGFAIAQYLVRAALMLRGIIAMRLLSPMSYGAWNALTLLLDYGSLAPLSTQQGLDQAVPGRIVAAEPAGLDRLKRAGLFNVLVFTTLFAAASLAYLIGSDGRIQAFWGTGGLLAAMLCIGLINVSYYHITLLRSHGNIGAVSIWFALQAGIGTVLGLSLIPAFGARALLVGWITGTAVGLAYARRQGRGLVPIVPRPSSDGGLLLRVGLPMYLYTASTVAMRSLDRLVILRFLGTEKLGYYSLSVMVLGLLLYLPDSVAFVLYPHFLRRYHSAGDRAAAIRDEALRSLQVLAVAVPALCGFTFLIARDGAFILLPRYLPGIGAARIMCFAAGAIALANVSSILLMTLGRQRRLVAATALVTLLGAGLDYLVVRLGYGITGVAWATLATFTLGGVLFPWLSLGGLGLPVVERLAWLARLLAPLALSLLFSFSVDRLMPWSQLSGTGVRLARMALGVLVFAGGYALACLPLVRGLGLRQLLREFDLRVPGLPRPSEAAGD